MSQVTQQSGPEAWVCRVRNELASASGMAEFTERVQTRGFDWMSSFVNSVLQDEIIVEMAKTPGRQKSAKKTLSHGASSAAKLKAINSENADMEIDSCLANVTTNTVLPQRHSPSPNHTMPGALPKYNPFIPVAPTSRVPLAILEERPEEAPNAEAIEAGAPWKPELSTKTIPLPVPSPTKEPTAPLSPMKLDRPSLEELAEGSFHSVPLYTPAKPSISLAMLREQLISEGEGTDNKSPRRTQSPPALAPTPKDLPGPPTSYNRNQAASEEARTSPNPASSRRDRSITSSQPVASVPESGLAAVLLTCADARVAPPVNTHIDVVVPSNDGDGISRQFLFRRGSQSARQSRGFGLRRSTFARSFAPRSCVVPSSAGDAAAAAAAIEVVNASNAVTSNQCVAPQPAQSAKRKSDALDDDEATRVDDAPKIIWKLEQYPTPALVEKDTELKSTSTLSLQEASAVAVPPLPAVSPASSALGVTEAGILPEPRIIVTPEAEVSSKTPLAQLTALAQGLATGSRTTTSGAALAESTNEPGWTSSLYPNTRTFDMCERVGDNYEYPSSPKSGSERCQSESSGFSDNITPDDGADVVRYPDAGHGLSDGDGEDQDGGPLDDDMAITFDKESFTPANSPPRSTMRTEHSVPEAMTDPQTNVTAGEAAVDILARLDGTLEVDHSASASKQHGPVGSTSATSILSVAKAVVTNFFKFAVQQPAATAPPPGPAQAPSRAPRSAAAPSVTNVPRPKAFKPFTAEPRPAGIGINPFSTKPLPPPPAEESQSTQQVTRSMAFSSQATGGSFFDSQPFMRRASYENPGYETDITESQFNQSRIEKSTPSGKIEDDLDDVATALSQASPDASMHLRRSLVGENIPTVINEPVPANRLGGATPSGTAIPAAKVSSSPAKTLKHVPNIASLSAEKKIDAHQAAQSAKWPVPVNGGMAKTAGAGKPDAKKREQEEAALKVAQPVKSKTEDDANKKRNLVAETKSKTKQAPTRKSSLQNSKQPTRPPFRSNFKPVSSMATSASGAPPKMAGGLPMKSSALSSTAAMRPPPQAYVNLHAQIQAKTQATLHAQIAKEKAALLVKAQIQQKVKHGVEAELETAEEEEIELPEIASEYSNSDDEDRPNKVIAEWAEPAELEKLLIRQQAEIDPDQLFGEVGEPNLEAMFGFKKKFRVRSSSANWHNGDGLTAAESADYARQMGWGWE